MNNELDSCLSELDNILNSLMTANFYQEYLITNGPSFGNEIENILMLDKVQSLSDIIFEHMIIQLYKLFEIHSQLGKCLVNINQKKLMQSLKEDWKDIYKNKGKIILWRNKLITHSEKQSKNYVPYYKVDPNYRKTIYEIFSISRYAVTYLWAILRNITTQFVESTETKYEEMNNLEKEDAIRLLAKTIINEKKFFKKINNNLKKNGFDSVIYCGYEKWPMNVSEK